MRLFKTKNTILPPTDTITLRVDLFVGICGTSAMVLVWIISGWIWLVPLFMILGLRPLVVYAYVRLVYERRNKNKRTAKKADGIYVLIHEIFVLAFLGFIPAGANSFVVVFLFIVPLSLLALGPYVHLRLRCNRQNPSASGAEPTTAKTVRADLNRK